MRQHTTLSSFALACAMSALCMPLVAQSNDGSTLRSTLDGVYNEAQSNSGSDVYATMCTACHTPESHTGTVFYSWWAGLPLSEQFSYISEKMPQDNPGSLSRQEYLQIVAYLLEMNGMPTGSTELAIDSLETIRFDTVPANGRPPSRVDAPAGTGARTPAVRPRTRPR